MAHNRPILIGLPGLVLLAALTATVPSVTVVLSQEEEENPELLDESTMATEGQMNIDLIDPEGQLLPAVEIYDEVTISVDDSPQVIPSVKIHDQVTVTVSDSPRATPSVKIHDQVTVTVSDSSRVVPAVQIHEMETVEIGTEELEPTDR